MTENSTTTATAAAHSAPSTSTAKDRLLLGLKNGIEPEPDSVASDYSEMADPIKEHLANVQIIQKEDLETGNTMFPDQFTVGQRITQRADETEEEFARRLRKVNYLSLAQEFAALKKVDADALPFGLQKGAHKLQDIASPMSETSSEGTGSDRYLTDSADVTPMESVKDFVPRTSSEGGVGSQMPDVTLSAMRQDPSNTTANQTSISTTNSITTSQNTANGAKATTKTTACSVSSSSKLDNEKRNKTLSSPDHRGQSPKRHAGLAIKQKQDSVAKHTDISTATATKRVDKIGVDTVDGEGAAVQSGVKAEGRKGGGGGGSEERLGDFDVYNIETTLPQVDWETLEKQLRKAAEEEQQKAMVSMPFML